MFLSAAGSKLGKLKILRSYNEENIVCSRASETLPEMKILH